MRLDALVISSTVEIEAREPRDSRRRIRLSRTLTCRSLPFRQEKQEINAEVAEVAEKRDADAKILSGLCAPCVEALA